MSINPTTGTFPFPKNEIFPNFLKAETFPIFP